MTQDEWLRIEKRLDVLVNLLALECISASKSKGKAILTLSKAGLDRKRIADLLGTTPNTVSVTISTSKKSRSRKIETMKEADNGAGE